MRIWDDVISRRDRQVYESAGYGKTRGLSPANSRPALMVIDVTVNFVGDKPEPILESIKRYPNSCGEEGWKSMMKIAELLPAARALGTPIFYSLADSSESGEPDASWERKKSRHSSDEGNRIPEEIAPAVSDVLVRKKKPSMFFGTPLISELTVRHVDTVIVTGCTTSGCVRATVLDAFSYGFKVGVVEECVFDRGEVPHKVNLFDMNQKYADVISFKDTLDYFESLSSGQSASLRVPLRGEKRAVPR